MIDPRDPANHGKPLWVVYGIACFPQLLCAKLRSYSSDHALLPVGTEGQRICIWGYSVYRNQPGFRTLGVSLEEWSKRSGMAPEFYSSQDDALGRLRELTTPPRGM